MTRGKLELVALAVLVLACASLPQGIGWNQNASYALVRAFADGTAAVDPYRDETGDVAWVDGHYYSTKPPGLAFVTLPLYILLDGTGALELMSQIPGIAGEAVGALWTLGLIGCVLPAALLLVLLRGVGDLVAPGYGLAVAVAAGAGTLLLPFSTLFFAHVLSAALGFAAWVLLWRERERGMVRPGVAAAAGLLAGFAVVVHYSLAVVAGVVGLYVLATRPRLRNALLYGGGAFAGVAPLLLYNWWAFGSPTHLSYRNAVLVGGESGHDVLGANAAGFFGIERPSLDTSFDLLFGRIGLVTSAPVLAAATVGVLLLARRRRAEALVIAAVALLFVTYNAGYVDPFGGFSPGPRFLVPVLPFLAVGLAPAFQRLPVTTVALASVSIAIMVTVTITQPLLAFDGRWLERVENGSFGGHGIAAVPPFVALVGTSIVLVGLASPRPVIARIEVLVAMAATVGWLALFLATGALIDPSWAEVGAVLLAGALVGVLATAPPFVARRRPKPLATSAPVAR